MPAAYRSIYVTFEANTQKLGTALKNIDSEATSVTRNLKEVNKGLKLDPQNTELLAKKFATLSDGIYNAEKRLKMLREARSQAEAQLGGLDKTSQQYKDLEAQIASLDKELERSGQLLANYQREARNASAEITDRLKEGVSALKEEFASAASVIAKAEAALAAYTAASVKTGAEFSAAMSQVAATTGVTADTEDYAKMSAAAKEMGETTSFTASQAAFALNALSQAGYNADEAVAKLPKTLTLAKDGGLDLAQAAKIVTNSMSSLKLEEEDLNKLIDELAVTAQKSNTNIAELGEAIKVTGGTVSMTGQSMETMYTELGILANNGIVAAEAGTHLRNALLALAAPSTKGAKALKELGVSLTDGQGNMRDYGELLTDLSKRLDEIYGVGKNNAARTEALKEIFKVTDLTAINAMLDGTSGKMQELRANIDSAEGAADQMAQTMGDNLKGDFDILKSSAEGLQLAIAEKLDPAMRKAAQDGTDFFADLTQEVKSGELGETFEDLGETINKLLKTGLENASKWLPVIIEFLAKVAEHFDTILALYLSMQAYAKSKAIITAVGESIAAIVSLVSVIKSAESAQMALNTVAAANPIGAIATAAATVIAGLTFAITKAAEKIDVMGDEWRKASKEVQDYADTVDKLNDSVLETNSAHEKSISAISTERTELLALAEAAESLAQKQDLTKSEYEQLNGYIDKLNEAVPGLNLAFDDQTNSLNMADDALQSFISSYEAYQEQIARIDYGTDLAKQKIVLEDQKAELTKRYEDARAIMNTSHNGSGGKIDSDDTEVSHAYTVAEENAVKYGEALLKVSENLRNVTEKETANNEALADLTKRSEEYSEIVKDQTEAEEKAAEAADKATHSADDLQKAYDSAKSATSTYKSELKDLIGVLSQVQQGTAYSTSQILDLIEKYPQLAGAIRETADGYLVEADAVRQLTKAKADEMTSSVKAEIAVLEGQMSKLWAYDIDPEKVAERRKLEQQLAVYQSIADSIANGKIYQGSTSSSGGSSSGSGTSASSSDSSADDWLKERKAQAKAEEAELESRYKTEKITAEEYYNGLMDIAERYYAGIGELREEYLSAENKVYEGLKKAQEDELSNAKKLEDQLRAIKDAEDELRNAQTQQVSVYSAAAGYHAETNTAAVEKARQTLADKNYTLAETLLKNARFSGESLAERLQSIGLADIRAMLPDLSGLHLPSMGGGTTTTNNSTRNVTYNGGDINITITGSVDEQTLPKLKNTVEDSVRRVIEQMLDEENAERQTGGI